MDKFSPRRAVLFWTPDRGCGTALVMLGMKIYIYDALNIPMPVDYEVYYKDAQVVYDYVVMKSPWDLFELIDYIESDVDVKKNSIVLPYTASVRPCMFQWKEVSKYYNKVIEKMAAVKSAEMTDNVLTAADFDSIIPAEPVDIKELKYRDYAIETFHTIAYTKMHEDPIGLLRGLTTFMKDQSQGYNLYTCMFLHNVAKSCKLSNVVRLRLRTAVITQGLCFGPDNKYVRKIIKIFTLLFCPWCYKPINVAVKRKSSAGGAHKSQIFTDEYTHDPLYCVEKNKRGIIVFPLLGCDKDGKVYSNTLEWDINRGFTRVFSIKTTGLAAKLVISHKQKDQDSYTPVISERMCRPTESCLICHNHPPNTKKTYGQQLFMYDSSALVRKPKELYNSFITRVSSSQDPPPVVY